MQKISSLILWFVASLFYAYQYILRVLLNIMMPYLIEKFHVDATLLGQFSGIYYIGYVLIHLPLGLLLDRVGPKIVMPLCILMAVGGMLPLMYADSWTWPVVGRAFVGMGSSGAILGVFSMTRLCFPEGVFSRMLGFAVTIGLLGAIYGGRPVYYLLSQWGWEPVFQMICGLGVGLALVTFLLTPSFKKKKVENASVFYDMMGDMGKVFKNPLLLSTCLLGGLMVGPLEGFADVWASQFLRIVYGYEESIAASLPSLIFLGMCVGSPLLTYLGDKTKKAQEIIIMSALGMGGAFALLLGMKVSVVITSSLFLFIGILCAYQILVIDRASIYVPSQLASIATATANMIIMAFGYIFHTIIGRSMDFFWDGQLSSSGAPLYQPEAFQGGLLVIPVGLGIAFLGFLFIRIFAKKKEVS